MLQITVEVEGMMCPHCEAHVNSAVSKAFKVEKVASSHAKKQTVILTKDDIDEAKLREVIAGTGYKVGAIQKKKKLLAFIK
ncbi:MAG: cation transporter [Oscillospiraceae bacterium]|nr:cation transporter [Oscillospiraceae bacterium]